MKHIDSLAEVGRTVATLRKERGMTQTALAAACGLGQSTVARFETGGVAEFGTRKLMRMLEVLGYGLACVPVKQSFTLDEALAARSTAT
jgi:HTH-type transcriptional regulator / antitoxin HipB